MTNFSTSALTALAFLTFLQPAGCASTGTEDDLTNDGSGGNGLPSGGQPTGGSSAGGSESGGVSSGGASSGGVSSGGMETGGAGTGGAKEFGLPSGGSSDPGDASFELVRYMVDLGCSATICHGGCLDFVLLDDSLLYDKLMNTVVPECENNPLITPGQPEASALYRLISGGCPDLQQMPNGCIEGDSCVPTEWRDRISQWITNGAPQ